MLLDTQFQYKRYKCLGRSVGTNATGASPHQVITYADSSLGLVREQSEAPFLQLEQLISTMPASVENTGIVTRMGLFDGVYYIEDYDLQEQLRSKTLLLYWAHCKEPTSGICFSRSEVVRRPGALSCVLLAPRN